MGKIVWLASYPKSGNTWMRLFLGNLFVDSDQPMAINELGNFSPHAARGVAYSRFTDKNPIDLSYEELAIIRPKAHRLLAESRAGTVFVKTHSFLGESCKVPTITPDLTAGAIYIVRNPLDVCPSFAKHSGSEPDRTIEYMREDNALSDNPEQQQVLEPVRSWSTHVKSWTQVPQKELCVVRYEDLVSDPIDTFTKVSRFLQTDFDAARIQKALDFCSIQQLRKQEESDGFGEKFDKSKSFFGQGAAGQWASKLNEQQIKSIVDDHRDQMQRFDYIPAGY